MVKINEIFYSIQGEGIHQGIPMVFVRFQGCNLIPRCRYCDTPSALSDRGGKEMEVKDILDEIGRLSPYYRIWVCITGGEPLWQLDGLEDLVRRLKMGGYQITIETNGTFRPPRWYGLVDSWNADIKCPSSGVCGVSSLEWFKTRFQDQIKFVVGTKEDLDFARGLIRKHWADSPVILVSPIFSSIPSGWLQEVAEFCKEEEVRLSLQLHKVIWGDREGV